MKRKVLLAVVSICSMAALVACCGCSASQDDTSQVDQTEEADVVEEVEATDTTGGWTVDGYGQLDVSIESGNDKKVTLLFENNNRSWLTQYFFNAVTVDGKSYYVSDGVNGFEGCPLVSNVDGKKYDYFVGGIEVYEDDSCEVTLSMENGKELPSAIEFLFDAQEVDEYASGEHKSWDYNSETLTLEREQ